MAKAKTTKQISSLHRSIQPVRPLLAEKNDLKNILNKATSEAPLQTYISRHPSFLLNMLPHGRNAEIFDRPKLGSQFIPDFLINIENSQGKHWACIELETPTCDPLTSAGVISSKLNQAIGQINDWRDWLRQNISYAQTQLKLKDINGELDAWIIIGRRKTMTDKQKRRYASLKEIGINILSYDRLLD